MQKEDSCLNNFFFLVFFLIFFLVPSFSDAGSVSYTYDSLNRLTKAVNDDGTSSSYFYDDAGGMIADEAISPVAVTAISPSAGFVGDTATIAGNGFTGATSITLGGVSATITQVSDTQISIIVPQGASGDVVVTTSTGKGVLSGGFSYLTLTGIASTPSSVTLTGNSPTQQLLVQVILNDGSKRDISSQVTFSSTDSLTVSVSSAGLLTLNKSGSAAVTFNYGGLTGQTAITCIEPSIIGFSPPSALSEETLTINGTDLTKTTSVTIGGASANFTVISPAQIIAIVPHSALSGAISVSTPDGSATSKSGFTLLSVSNILATPSPLLLTPLTSRAQLSVNATLSDGSARNITSLGSYSTANGLIATVSSSGLVSFAASGTTAINIAWRGASLQLPVRSIKTTLASLTPTSGISGDKITLTGVDLDLVTSATLGGAAATLSGTPTNNSLVVIVKDGATGNAVVTTPYQTVSLGGFRFLTVEKLEVNPEELTIKKIGGTYQLKTIATLTNETNRDITAHAVYTSSNPKVASVSSTGVVTALSKGTTVIKAKFLGKSDETTIKIEIKEEKKDGE